MDRTFKGLRAPSGKDDGFELAWGERVDDSGISWDELLKSRHILIVAEAGAGKTYECESKALELFARGSQRSSFRWRALCRPASVDTTVIQF